MLNFQKSPFFLSQPLCACHKHRRPGSATSDKRQREGVHTLGHRSPSSPHLCLLNYIHRFYPSQPLDPACLALEGSLHLQLTLPGRGVSGSRVDIITWIQKVEENSEKHSVIQAKRGVHFEKEWSVVLGASCRITTQFCPHYTGSAVFFPHRIKVTFLRAPVTGWGRLIG